MASHEYQCIFIHIPKTAGTSIEKKLGAFNDGVQDHRTIQEIKDQLASGREKSISPSQFNSYFKFAFVRNSWARVFSYYQDVMRGEIHQNNYGISARCSFKEFLKNHIDIWGLKSQLYWIMDEKYQIPLDFIGRFETLEKDFTHVCERLGITDTQLPKLLVRDDKLHYTEVYDEEMKTIVANNYAEEIALFNFEYGE